MHPKLFVEFPVRMPMKKALLYGTRLLFVDPSTSWRTSHGDRFNLVHHERIPLGYQHLRGLSFPTVYLPFHFSELVKSSRTCCKCVYPFNIEVKKSKYNLFLGIYSRPTYHCCKYKGLVSVSEWCSIIISKLAFWTFIQVVKGGFSTTVQ